MFKLILYKELREIIGTAKFAVTFGICSILIILAFFTGIKNYQSGMQEYKASQAAELRKHEKRTSWDEVNNIQIFLTPDPLASLVMGVSNDTGRAANIDGRLKPSTHDSTYSQQPVFAVFRYLDLEFVFQIILSLFAILFAFDAVNGEKERGTLRLSFANSVPRASYILGKLVGSFLALALPLLVPVLMGVLLLPLMGLTLSGEEWLKLALFIICGMLYLGVFLTLSIFISCLTKRSSSSFLFLLVIWVCSVLIIPKASVLIAGNTVKVPSTAEIYAKVAQLTRQNSRDMEGKLGDYLKNLRQEQTENKDNSPEFMERKQKELDEFLQNTLDENNESVENLRGRLYEDRRNKQIKQERLAFGIARISPTAVFTLAATTICGTSLDLRNYFQEKAAEYSQSFAEFIRSKTGKNIGGQRIMIRITPMEEEKKPPQPINLGEIPEFTYKSPELSVVLQDAVPDLAILMLFNLIFFCGAFVAFLRYDLR